MEKWQHHILKAGKAVKPLKFHQFLDWSEWASLVFKTVSLHARLHFTFDIVHLCKFPSAIKAIKRV